VSFDPEDLRIEGNPFRVDPSPFHREGDIIADCRAAYSSTSPSGMVDLHGLPLYVFDPRFRSIFLDFLRSAIYNTRCQEELYLPEAGLGIPDRGLESPGHYPGVPPLVVV
jgi:hypothetical protein